MLFITAAVYEYFSRSHRSDNSLLLNLSVAFEMTMALLFRLLFWLQVLARGIKIVVNFFKPPLFEEDKSLVAFLCYKYYYDISGFKFSHLLGQACFCI